VTQDEFKAKAEEYEKLAEAAVDFAEKKGSRTWPTPRVICLPTAVGLIRGYDVVATVALPS
jgi:hypothetical protein